MSIVGSSYDLEIKVYCDKRIEEHALDLMRRFEKKVYNLIDEIYHDFPSLNIHLF